MLTFTNFVHVFNDNWLKPYKNPYGEITVTLPHSYRIQVFFRHVKDFSLKSTDNGFLWNLTGISFNDSDRDDVWTSSYFLPTNLNLDELKDSREIKDHKNNYFMLL